MVRQAPFGQNRAAARDDAGDAIHGQRNMRQPNPGMHGEVIDALLALFDQGVAVQIPGQFLSDAAAFFQRLIDRHRADRYRRVADQPFADGVDVAAGGKIHHRVGAPPYRPHHLFHFLGHARGNGGIADVGIDLGEKIAADDHRLGFRMIDIGGDNGAAAGNFATHEFGRDRIGDRRTEILPVARCGTAKVLASGDEFHFLGDDPGTGIMHLGRPPARLRPQRQQGAAVEFRHADGFAFLKAVVPVVDRPPRIFLDVAAGQNPLAAQGFQALLDVDLGGLVGIRTGGIV